jgi:hypothetical protein
VTCVPEELHQFGLHSESFASVQAAAGDKNNPQRRKAAADQAEGLPEEAFGAIPFHRIIVVFTPDHNA